ncbi:MAG: hypothetical protein WCA76_02305 [Candidatus Sulfotelmatobacter sp.]
MPKRIEARVRALRVAISREIMRIEGIRFRGAVYADEIVNTALMEIATGQSLRLQRWELNEVIDALQSISYQFTAHS